MNITARHDLLDPATVPTLLIALGAAVCAVCWWSSHSWRPPVNRPSRRAIATILRLALGTACLWLSFQTLGRSVHFATAWPLWLAAVAGALSVEFTVAIYAHERRLAGGRLGTLLSGLRTAAILGLVVVLMQPTWATEQERERQRELVILVDDSASMGLTDERVDIATKLEIAALFGIDAATRENTLSDATRALSLLDKRLARESDALQLPNGVSPAAANTLIAKRAPTLKEFLEDAARQAMRSAEIVARERDASVGLSEASTKLLSDYDTRIRENIARELARAAVSVGKARYAEARGVIHGVSRQLHFVLQRLPAAAEETDALYYDSLDRDQRAAIDAATIRSRLEIAREALLDQTEDGSAIIDVLRDRYRLRFLRFAHGYAEIDGEQWLDSGRTVGAEQESSGKMEQAVSPTRTDLTAALEGVLESGPASELAGVLLLSDGRHNGERPAEEGVRRLGIQGIPICSIAVGSEIGPRDAAVLAVRSPESIYQDDRAIIRADIKLDGLSGSSVKVDLYEGGTMVASQTVEVSDDSLRSTVRFAHTPDEIGIFDYEVVIAPQADEAFADNNRWRFQLAVADDRTNVLLVDDRPRWEFRYLRNLFYGRDKSVHLQHVLLSPDGVTSEEPPPLVYASAARKFGDCEATALPRSRDEWLRFDAIILGDIPPDALTAEDWASLNHAVSERGSLLVVIAGSQSMPHAFGSTPLADMLPAAVSPRGSTDSLYRLRLTSNGRSHPIMQQSLAPAINAIVWAGLPALDWRHKSGALKPTAEVLAWAEPVSGTLSTSLGRRFDTAEQRLAFERDNALILTQRYALGRCVQINFDATWRLRYGVGDVYHHTFWGQILRWGAGENLRAGTELIRLGSDRLSYRPAAQATVLAKLLTEEHRPMSTDDSSVAIYRDDRLLLREKFTPRPDSNGMYEAQIEAPTEPGRYRMVLESDTATGVLAATSEQAQVETELIVRGDENAVEFAELTADPDFLRQLANLSSGAVSDPTDAESLFPFFKDPGRVVRERREVALWDNFGVLALLLAIVGLEWMLRRRAGLV